MCLITGLYVSYSSVILTTAKDNLRTIAIIFIMLFISIAL